MSTGRHIMSLLGLKDYLENNMNYKTLANKGRYGDSELRNVAGRTSHVNPREADIIDLWGALGESLVQREGAGTMNPMTGLPEYHKKKGPFGISIPHSHWIQENIIDPIVENVIDPIVENVIDPVQENLLDPIQENVIDPIAEWTGTTGMNLPEAVTHLTTHGLVDTSGQGQGSVLNIDFDDMSVSGGDNNEYFDLTPDDDGGGGDGGGGTGGYGRVTRDEFRDLVEGGNIDALIENIGMDFDADAEDFGDIFDFTTYTDPEGVESNILTGMSFIERGKDITGGILTDRLEREEETFKDRSKRIGIDAGRGVYDAKQQIDAQLSRGGFAGSGLVSTAGRRATGNIFQDYKMQQEELSKGLDFARRDYGWGQKQMDLDYDAGVYDYWTGLEDRFYDRVDWLEGQ